ncbi:hypothetical protein Tco_1229549 [Tanacetum coccineum]
MSSFRSIEEKIYAGCANDKYRVLRVNRLQELDGLEKLESMDMVQKARVKWEVEGDENSKFFHGILHSRRKSQMIQEPVPSSCTGRFYCGDETAKNRATVLAGSVPLQWPVPLR